MDADCYKCEHQKNISGDAQIRCNNPDSQMTGRSHAIHKGWFNYPYSFDPIWRTKECRNFTKKNNEPSTNNDEPKEA